MKRSGVRRREIRDVRKDLEGHTEYVESVATLPMVYTLSLDPVTVPFKSRMPRPIL